MQQNHGFTACLGLSSANHNFPHLFYPLVWLIFHFLRGCQHPPFLWQRCDLRCVWKEEARVGWLGGGGILQTEKDFFKTLFFILSRTEDNHFRSLFDFLQGQPLQRFLLPTVQWLCSPIWMPKELNVYPGPWMSVQMPDPAHDCTSLGALVHVFNGNLMEEGFPSKLIGVYYSLCIVGQHIIIIFSLLDA